MGSRNITNLVGRPVNDLASACITTPHVLTWSPSTIIRHIKCVYYLLSTGLFNIAFYKIYIVPYSIDKPNTELD